MAETAGDQQLAGQTAEDRVPAVWKPGDVILDLYEVKEVHEGGGMGLVYRVHHRGWNVDLAVKSPRPEFFRNDKDKENLGSKRQKASRSFSHLGHLLE